MSEPTATPRLCNVAADAPALARKVEQIENELGGITHITMMLNGVNGNGTRILHIEGDALAKLLRQLTA